MPYVGLVKKENGEIEFDNGIFVEVFKELSKLLNFSYTITSPPDGEWGAARHDGTWTGMVGQLETKTVDFGMLNS